MKCENIYNPDSGIIESRWQIENLLAEVPIDNNRFVCEDVVKGYGVRPYYEKQTIKYYLSAGIQ